jgi:CRP/FNR family cyclic AMP-dependent transcriptional regulator
VGYSAGNERDRGTPKRSPSGVERWLAALPGEVRETVRRLLRRHTFVTGELLVREGEPGDALWMIEAGHVAAQATTGDGVVTTVNVMGAGDVFGELALINPGGVRTVSVVALGRVEAISLGRDEFELLRARYPAIDRFLVEVLADHVVRLTQLLRDAYARDAETRVLRRLLALAATSDGPVDVPIDQATLAGLAGASRQTANRVLREAVDAGWVALGRRRITVLDLDRLRAAAGTD